MFKVWKGPLFRISTLSDYKRLTFKDFLRNENVHFWNRVKILVGPPKWWRPGRLPHLPHSKSAPGHTALSFETNNNNIVRELSRICIRV